MSEYLSKSAPSDYNYSVSLLRLWMAYEVVYLHAGGPLSVWMMSAVPVFMTLSFIYATRSLVTDPVKRIKRLIYPYIFWCIINYAVLGIMGLLNPSMPSPTLRGFIAELFCGTADVDATQLWFSNVLIIISILVWCIHRLCGLRWTVIFMAALGAASLIYEYVGMDLLVQSVVGTDERFFLLRAVVLIPQMMPYMACGLIFYATGLLDILKKKRVLSLPIAVVLLAADILIPHPDFMSGWMYGGLGHLCTALLLVTAFYLMPFELLPDKVKSGVRLLSRYTMGIYMCHIIIKQLYENLFAMHERLLHSIAEAVVVFIASWITCFAIDRLTRGRMRSMVT